MTPFDIFWKAFPRKVGKSLCRAKFEVITTVGMDIKIDGHRINLRASPEDVIRAAKAYATVTWDEDIETQFMPHPATWLNQGRFEDVDEDEQDERAARYDNIRRRVEENKLRVV